jgi:hypothetical protein
MPPFTARENGLASSERMRRENLPNQAIRPGCCTISEAWKIGSSRTVAQVADFLRRQFEQEKIESKKFYRRRVRKRSNVIVLSAATTPARAERVRLACSFRFFEKRS